MTNRPSITDFRNMDETNRTLLIWQGLSDIWNKLQETIDHQKEIEADTSVHHRLLITGNGELSVLERLRREEDFTKGMKYWLRFVGGALILQTLTFFVGIIVALIRFLPILERIAQQP